MHRGPASSYAPSSFLRQPEPKKLSARRKSFTFPGVIGHQLISDFMYVRRTAELDTLTAMRAYLPLRAVFYVVFSASNRLTRDWRADGGEHALPVERYVEAVRRVRPPNSSTMAGSACAK